MTAFRRVEGDRTIVFGPGALRDGADLISTGYTLLTTPRAIAAAPELAAGAASRIDVPSGLVEDIAGDLIGSVDGRYLVALGGGRVIDVAKALAAARGGSTVLAIPTTLSGAEMTRLHRHARGTPANASPVRPATVINDPALSASQPLEQLAASSANALGHALVAVVSRRSDPISASAGREAVCHMASAWRSPDPDRERMALAALLAGWAVDCSGLGLHHALSQSAVRTAALGHAEANAALLPETIAACRRRAPGLLETLDSTAGEPFEALAWRLRRLLPARSSRVGSLESAVDMAVGRPELDFIPPRPARDELRMIFADALAASGR